MENFFAEHLDAIVTLIVGLLGGGALVKFSCKKDSNESNKFEGIDTGGGDFAGRDMNKNEK